MVLAQAPQLASAQTIDPYFEFLMGRRLESQGDAKAALAAFERAATAAPKSADIRAEIAAYYLRHNQPEAAEKAARAALALDGDNIEGHRVLGLLLAGTPAGMKEAATHLERVYTTPAGATDVSVQFTLGRAYLLSGASAKGIDVLQRLVEEQPYLVQARVLLVQALTSAGRREEAIDVLAPAAGADPRLTSTLAQLYEQAGRNQEAADAYGKAVSLNPGNRELLIKQASALLAVGTKDAATRALDVLRPLLDRTPKDAGALYLQAQAYRRAGDIFAAERSARAILGVDPNSVPGAFALAQVFGQARRYKDVVSHLESFIGNAAGRDADVSSLLTFLSSAYQSLGEYDKAIGALSRAKVSQPKDANIDAYLVQAHVAAKKYQEAVILADDAQKLYPDDPRFAQLQARALFLSGSQAKAMTALESRIAQKPEELDVYLTLAQLYGEGGRIDDGLSLLDKAAAKFPEDSTTVLFRRGAVLAEANREAEAERVFLSLIEQDGKNADALNYLGYMWADRGQRLDEAVRYITTALEVDEDNPSFLDSLGWARFKQGNLADAEKHLTRAADALPFNSVVQDHYGDLLARLGRHKDAMTAWTKALSGDGDAIDRAAIERKIREARAKKP